MRKFKVMVNGVAYQVEVEEEGTTGMPIMTKKEATPAPAPVKPVAAPAPAAPAAAPKAPVAVGADETAVTAPMPGKIVKTVAKAGQKVQAGDVLVILEAMKMQNEITATVAGVVKDIAVTVGQSVKPGETLAVIGK